MKCFLKWTMIVVGVLILIAISVIGLFLGWLRWSGERDWKQAEAELRAKGEKLTFAELVPPMPPDSENFFADPIWSEYADLVPVKNTSGIESWSPRLPSEQRQLQRWEEAPLSSKDKEDLRKLIPGHQEFKTRNWIFTALRTQLHEEKNPEKQKEVAALLLNVISPAEPALTQISKLSERPQAQFPTRYDLGPSVPLPEITVILRLSQTLAAKSLAELVLGKNSEAAADTLTLLRFGFCERNSPLLISFLVRVASVAMAVQSVDEGILRHAWSESNLRNFQNQLERIKLREAYLVGLRGERAFFNQWDSVFVAELMRSLPTSTRFPKPVEKVYSSYLACVVLKNKAFHNLFLQRKVESLKSSIPTGWNAISAESVDQELKEITRHPLKKWIYELSALSLPGPFAGALKTAITQAQVDQCLIACALERCRIARGSYPTSLEVLAPEYLAKIPNSPITGKPMNYSLKPDGTFLLWTPSWELKSLGGKPGEYFGEGDIVWGQPLPKLKRPQEQSPSRQ